MVVLGPLHDALCGAIKVRVQILCALMCLHVHSITVCSCGLGALASCLTGFRFHGELLLASTKVCDESESQHSRWRPGRSFLYRSRWCLAVWPCMAVPVRGPHLAFARVNKGHFQKVQRAAVNHMPGGAAGAGGGVGDSYDVHTLKRLFTACSTEVFHE
jgi:hypothetical protein